MTADPRTRNADDWTRELLADDLAAIGWTLTEYDVRSRAPWRAYAAVNDSPGFAGRRITAGDPTSLYIRCSNTSATRAYQGSPPPPVTIANPAAPSEAPQTIRVVRVPR